MDQGKKRRCKSCGEAVSKKHLSTCSSASPKSKSNIRIAISKPT